MFKHWRGYLKVCVPGLIGVFIEWTSWEASTFLAVSNGMPMELSPTSVSKNEMFSSLCLMTNQLFD